MLTAIRVTADRPDVSMNVVCTDVSDDTKGIVVSNLIFLVMTVSWLHDGERVAG